MVKSKTTEGTVIVEVLKEMTEVVEVSEGGDSVRPRYWRPDGSGTIELTGIPNDDPEVIKAIFTTGFTPISTMPTGGDRWLLNFADPVTTQNAMMLLTTQEHGSIALTASLKATGFMRQPVAAALVPPSAGFVTQGSAGAEGFAAPFQYYDPSTYGYYAQQHQVSQMYMGYGGYPYAYGTQPTFPGAIGIPIAMGPIPSDAKSQRDSKKERGTKSRTAGKGGEGRGERGKERRLSSSSAENAESGSRKQKDKTGGRSRGSDNSGGREGDGRSKSGKAKTGGGDRSAKNGGGKKTKSANVEAAPALASGDFPALPGGGEADVETAVPTQPITPSWGPPKAARAAASDAVEPAAKSTMPPHAATGDAVAMSDERRLRKSSGGDKPSSGLDGERFEHKTSDGESKSGEAEVQEPNAKAIEPLPSMDGWASISSSKDTTSMPTDKPKAPVVTKMAWGAVVKADRRPSTPPATVGSGPPNPPAVKTGESKVAPSEPFATAQQFKDEEAKDRAQLGATEASSTTAWGPKGESGKKMTFAEIMRAKKS